jgi:hypothetical protein
MRGFLCENYAAIVLEQMCDVKSFVFPQILHALMPNNANALRYAIFSATSRGS